MQLSVAALTRRLDLETAYDSRARESTNQILCVAERVKLTAFKPDRREDAAVASPSKTDGVPKNVTLVTQLSHPRRMGTEASQRPGICAIPLPFPQGGACTLDVATVKSSTVSSKSGLTSTILVDLGRRQGIRVRCHCPLWSSALGICGASICQGDGRVAVLRTPNRDAFDEPLQDVISHVFKVPPTIMAVTLFVGDDTLIVSWNGIDACTSIPFRPQMPPTDGSLVQELPQRHDCILLQCTSLRESVTWCIEPVR
jgi:hypothetical protein